MPAGMATACVRAYTLRRLHTGQIPMQTFCEFVHFLCHGFVAIEANKSKKLGITRDGQ